MLAGSTPVASRAAPEAQPVYTVEMATDSPSSHSTEALVFRPLEFPADAELTVRFSEAAFVCSFGSAERFWAEAGRDGRKWIARVVQKLRQDPRTAVNAWLGEEIVGQVILGSAEPSRRGHALAAQLDAYAVGVLRAQGFRTATLNVSPSNASALRFYSRMGWRPLGPRPDAPYVDAMERTL